MKTITEFSGVVLRRAAKVRDEKTAAGVEAEALAEAVGTELGIAGERAARMLEALEAAGGKIDSVRLVRVFQGEEAPPKAKSFGEFHYVIDLVATARAQIRSDRDGRGGRGRDGKGRGRGAPGRGGPGGPGGPGGGPGRGLGGGPGRGGPGRGDRDQSHELGRGEKPPDGGAGWVLTRAPREEGDRRGRRDGRPGGPKKPRRPRGDGPPRPRRDDRAPPGQSA